MMNYEKTRTDIQAKIAAVNDANGAVRQCCEELVSLHGALKDVEATWSGAAQSQAGALVEAKATELRQKLSGLVGAAKTANDLAVAIMDQTRIGAKLTAFDAHPPPQMLSVAGGTDDRKSDERKTA